MKPLLRSVVGLALLLFWQAVDAHPGGLNARGCHNNRKTGGYTPPSLPNSRDRSSTPSYTRLAKGGRCEEKPFGNLPHPTIAVLCEDNKLSIFRQPRELPPKTGASPKRAVTGAAQTAPALIVAGENRQSNSLEQYDRSRFGGWVDADGDCLDTRQELLRESVWFSWSARCRAIRGNWVGAYSGAPLPILRTLMWTI